MKLTIGNDYKLNNVKEMKVTDEFLTLDKTITNCQNTELLRDCKTRKYSNAMIENCKCLPFTLREPNKVNCQEYQLS